MNRCGEVVTSSKMNALPSNTHVAQFKIIFKNDNEKDHLFHSRVDMCSFKINYFYLHCFCILVDTDRDTTAF